MFFVSAIYAIDEGQNSHCSSRNDTWHPLIGGYEASRHFVFHAPLSYKYAHAPPSFIFYFT